MKLAKLWAVEKLKNQSRKSMRARGRNVGVKTRPQIFLAKKMIFFNGSTAFRFPRNPKKSSSTAFQFLQQLSNFRPQIFLARNLIFFNGFPISEKSEKIFFNGFPISSTVFRFLLYCQNTHTVNILSFHSKLCNSCVKIFRHWVFCQILIAIHHTVLQVFKTCMLKWLFN